MHNFDHEYFERKLLELRQNKDELLIADTLDILSDISFTQKE